MQSRKTEHSYIDILQQSLEKKSKVLDRIMEANKEHAVIAAAEKFDPEAFDEVFDKKDALISEITDKSVAIQVEEKRNQEALMGRMDLLKREVHQAKNTKKIAANYYKNMSGLNVVEPQFMDRKK